MNAKFAKPFLKWAGGKSQIIHEIQKLLPKNFAISEYTYIEPFVGSGAMLFWLLNNFQNINRAVINDINPDLINVYRVIASNPDKLLTVLHNMQKQYQAVEHCAEKKKAFYYNKRESFNLRNTDKITHAALFIFLNRTCYNGLYRVNKNNAFNVPIGSYKNPVICNSENIWAVHKALQGVEILCGDFETTLNFAGNNTLFYFDPPYKPLNSTSNFNSYSCNAFTDAEQIRLNNFCSKISRLGHYWILSNSDVKNSHNNNNFFDNLYSNYSIKRIAAKRNINVNPDKRGELSELLIFNQEVI